MAVSNEVMNERQVERTPFLAPGEEEVPYEQLSGLERTIQSCLLRGYRRRRDATHGVFWIYREPGANMSARVYPNSDKESITVAVFDDVAETNDRAREDNTASTQPIHSQGVPIRAWSGDIRLVGNWRRRLRRSCGESVILAYRRPWCPKCRTPLILLERNDGSSQFFGCRKFPACDGSAGISDHDLERKKAATTSTRGGQYVPQPSATQR
jgi:hypothetical protein